MTAAADLISITSRSKISNLYPGLRPLVYRALEDVYITTRRRMNVVEGLRPFDYQLELYAKGRAFTPDGGRSMGEGVAPPPKLSGTWQIVDRRRIATNAKPGLSWHCYGLAFDAAWAGQDPWLEKEPEHVHDELWAAFASAVRAHGMEAGVDFRSVNGLLDLDHAQIRYGLVVPNVLELYESKGLSGVWAYCDQIRGVPLGLDWGPG